MKLHDFIEEVYGKTIAVIIDSGSVIVAKTMKVETIGDQNELLDGNDSLWIDNEAKVEKIGSGAYEIRANTTRITVTLF